MPNITRNNDSLVLTEQDVGGISEITILPDGRVYILGLSAAVLAVMQEVGLAGAALAACQGGGEKPVTGPRTEDSV